MITGFEEYTKELDAYEVSKLLPAIVSGMKTKRGKLNAITNKEAVKGMKASGFKISEVRFRKIMHVIRVSGMLPGIVGTSKGYYIAVNRDEWTNYLTSISERVRHITSLKDALEKQYVQWKEDVK